MPHRVIPILPAAPALPVGTGVEPRLRGRPDQLGRLLASLERLVGSTLGPALPRSAWLQELDVGDGEAVLSLAPALRRASFAQAAFELLKSELSDTDIYVTA